MPALTVRGRSLGPCEVCLEYGTNDSEAAVIVDGVPLCAFHNRAPMEVRQEPAQTAVAAPSPIPFLDRQRRPLLPKPTWPCRRGCGKPSHRGNCPARAERVAEGAAKEAVCRVSVPVASALGQAVAAVVERARRAAAPLPAVVSRRNGGILVDQLRGKVVRIASIRAESYVPQRSCGRMGEAWKAIAALDPGDAFQIENRDVAHATYTLRHLRTRAFKERRVLVCRRDGTDLFCWLMKPVAVEHVHEGRG